MSFSSDCKAEIMGRSGELKDCCLSSLLYGEMVFFSRIGPTEFSTVQENRDVLEHFVSTLANFGITLPEGSISTGQKLSTLKITDPDICRRLYEEYGFDNTAPSYNIDTGVFMCEDCARAFVAGAFLASGSVTDPAKGYHLEFSTHRPKIAAGLAGVLRDMDLEPRQAVRNYESVVYFKASEQIEDVLTTVWAYSSSIRVMEAKIEKELNNQVTRQVNCDTSNARKIADAAAGDIALFTRFLDSGGKELLSDELLEIAMLRIEQPVSSFADIAEMTGTGITKSGVNHRLRKIREIANAYFEQHDQK